MTEITIPSADGGSFQAYIALPKKPAPVVIMIQEIFGVNQEMRDKCDAMAKKGYVAVCPDLFWRIEPGIQLTDGSKKELDRAFELFAEFDIQKGLSDLIATADYMKTFDASHGRPIGAVGYCLGGKLAFLFASRYNLDAAVSYYGVGIERLTDEAKNMKNHMLMHIAEEDQFVSEEAQEQIKLALMPNRRFEIYTYPGCDHAFARTKGMHYNPSAAHEANERTDAFLARHLMDAEA